ncbi:type II toxin-antitoxin system VapC family toxin [Magnetospira sp. QH-2]|uniref:type II toxin-antitoxin system VapC family toxin n=1 Tax=Magnetospira sp. (strain QH-2) TaxID=1288970 RepID=UPI0003E81674|nr:type II toxin-antitoxin system VapC family toxin [Magnetospira sp. QH-2]CCQ74384.1 conserved protein of unknown function [Magnetospira sp. QH-2]
MIVVDSSAIVAILRGEEGFELLVHLLSEAGEGRISAVNHIEVLAVLRGRYRHLLESDYEALLREAGVSVAPVDDRVTAFTEHALRVYGKGRHPARLNLGDCFACGTARALDAPLLFQGDNFPQTDVTEA